MVCLQKHHCDLFGGAQQQELKTSSGDNSGTIFCISVGNSKTFSFVF